jgi:sigma-B regulation protein RsbU (phosphoserine phosphatase)
VFAIAGHPLPLVRRGDDGRVEEIGSFDGPPLGIEDGVRYQRQTACLRPGDTLVLYTDGLTEARHGEGPLLGDDEAQGCLAACIGLAAADVVRSLVARMHTHLDGKPPDDDVTIVVIEAVRAVPGTPTTPR